jgi:hypothetical protein
MIRAAYTAVLQQLIDLTWLMLGLNVTLRQANRSDIPAMQRVRLARHRVSEQQPIAQPATA